MQIKFDVGSYRDAAQVMGKAGTDVQASTSRLLGAASDLKVLGTNDTLGSVCQGIYSVFLDLFQETTRDLAGAYSDMAERLAATAQDYADVEDANKQASHGLRLGGY